MDFNMFLNYPGLRPAYSKPLNSTNQEIIGYNGSIFVNNEVFQCTLKKENSLWQMQGDTDIIKELNKQRFSKPDQLLQKFSNEMNKQLAENNQIPAETYRNVLREYKNFKNFYSFLENITLSSDFAFISVIYVDDKHRNHAVKIAINYNESKLFKIMETNLPVDLQAVNDSLMEVFDSFTWQVNKYQGFFDVMDVLDEHTWVIDPKLPTRADVKRRIMIGENLSCEFTFDPVRPMAMPLIKLIGPKQKTQEILNVLQLNFEHWNEKGDVLDELLQIFVFPSYGSLSHDEGLASCGICLCLRGEYNDLPEVYCSNYPCEQGFHHVCFCTYANKGSTGQKCPYCQNTIDCPEIIL